MTTTTVTLSRKYEGDGSTFDTVQLREPTHADYMALGKPQEWQPSANGPILLTFTEVVGKYIERLCVAPGAAAIQQIALEDSQALEVALLDFFSKGRTRLKSETSSSSNLDGASAKSNA